MLGEKMNNRNVNVWLINTGWSGGSYGVGKRISLKHTRSMIDSILKGNLENIEYKTHPIFGLNMPMTCTNVPSNILDPINTWEDKSLYIQKANQLANAFNENFSQFAGYASQEILDAAPTKKSEK